MFFCRLFAEPDYIGNRRGIYRAVSEPEFCGRRADTKIFSKFQLFTKQNFGFLKKGTIIGMWQILRLFYASFFCSDFRFAHFCLPWPYTLSYRNLIVTGGFRTVRPFCKTQKLCWNMKNKGSFDVANTKIPIIVLFFKKPKFC